jgi:hypothetical protein
MKKDLDKKYTHLDKVKLNKLWNPNRGISVVCHLLPAVKSYNWKN